MAPEPKIISSLLKESLLLRQVKRALPIFRHIFEHSLHEVENGKRVLILTDRGFPQRRLAPMLALGYYAAAQQLGLHPKIVNVFTNERKVRDNVAQELAKIPEKSIIILALSNKLEKHQEQDMFSKLLKKYNHKKITSTGLAAVKSHYFPLFMDICNVDFARMHKLGMRLKNYLDQAKEVTITTPAGTNLVLSVEGRTALSNDGFYKDTLGGNMPVGEVFIAPQEASVNGVFVIDGSIRTQETTYLVKNPIKLFIKDGIVEAIEGGQGAALLEATFKKAATADKSQKKPRVVAELGIGINPKARIKGPTIVNEKTIGTFHIAFGSNWFFGGKNKSSLHVDQVALLPTIKIDGKRIVFYKKQELH